MSWDPLDEEQDEAILLAAKKREVNNILKSYVGMYDVFSETLQNALDAVDMRSKLLGEADYEKRIFIKIDMQSQAISVTDNGIGFSEEKFKSFIAPNISFKSGGDTRGNKGVGSTFIAYGFNKVTLATKSPDYVFKGELADGRTWIDDKDNVVSRPKVKETEFVHEAFNEVDRGSSFTIYLGGKNTRPKNLNYPQAKTVEQWLYILLLKTPLGQINSKDSDIKCSVEIVNAQGESELVDEITPHYKFPHNEIASSMNLTEIQEYQQERVANGLDVSALPDKYLKLNGIYQNYTTEDILEFPSKKIGEEEKELIREFKITAYGYFCYSTSLFEELNDNKAGLRKGMRILRGGLQLANNSMPQGELISIPLTSNIGYQNQTHVVVHFVNADPDLGRKGFQPELKELAESISVGVVNKLKVWRQKVLLEDTGNRPSIEEEGDVFEWLNQQNTYAAEHPLVLTNPNFFKPVNEISILSKPQSEQDVIVLFNQLIAGGVIRGLNLLATSQSKQYDGVFKFVVKPPVENHKYDMESNPLGCQELKHREAFSSRPFILEYKHSMDGLIRELENGEKSEGEIKMLVAWDMGTMWERSYTVTSLLDIDNLQHRDFHGLTHIVSSGYNKFYAIILNELVDYLNDVNGVQAYHKEKYGLKV